METWLCYQRTHSKTQDGSRICDPSQTGLVCKEVSLNGAKEGDQQPAALLEAVAIALNCKRLAIDQSIMCDSYRSSGAKLLLGDDGWVDHLDNGVHYIFDVTKCMFSSGNISEKLRVAKLNCEGETVVDLYAGIGYFTLPYSGAQWSSTIKCWCMLVSGTPCCGGPGDRTGG